MTEKPTDNKLTGSPPSTAQPPEKEHPAIMSTTTPVLTGPQIRLRIANMLIAQGIKIATADYLRERLDEIFACVMEKGRERAQLRYEAVELCMRRNVDMTNGDVIFDSVRGLDAVVMGEDPPATMAERRAEADKKAKGRK